MADGLSVEEQRWAGEQIDEYRRRLAGYERYAVALKELLVAAARSLAPLAIVESRAKSIASFGQKIWRRRDVCDNPVDQFTDLCGARVITQTAAEVEAVADWIEDHFEVDWENTVDKRQRLRPTEFGYRSVHYIVSLEPGRFPSDGGRLPDIPNPRAEIQVRTLLEHAWANASHELLYKRSTPVPATLERELAAVAAVLESADAAFARVQRELLAHASGHAAHLSPEEMRAEVERLRLVLASIPHGVPVLVLAAVREVVSGLGGVSGVGFVGGAVAGRLGRGVGGPFEQGRPRRALDSPSVWFGAWVRSVSVARAGGRRPRSARWPRARRGAGGGCAGERCG
jgi:ppGpp synthetase/RelA/SpoT-type nucleotidyltranferase